MDAATLTRMCRALGACTFLPGHPHKRFARKVALVGGENLTEAQRRQVIRLAWRYRRQMPSDLVPSKDAVDAMDADWNARRAVERQASQDRRRAAREARRAARKGGQMGLPLGGAS